MAIQYQDCIKSFGDKPHYDQFGAPQTREQFLSEGESLTVKLTSKSSELEGYVLYVSVGEALVPKVGSERNASRASCKPPTTAKTYTYLSTQENLGERR